MKCVDELFDYIYALDGDISRADIPYLEENEEKDKISFDSCCRYIPFLFLNEAERSKKIHSKLEELKKRRKEDWKYVPELIEDWDNHEYSEKDFEAFLKQPYRFYRNDFHEWMNGYNAKPKNYEIL